MTSPRCGSRYGAPVASTTPEESKILIDNQMIAHQQRLLHRTGRNDEGTFAQETSE